MPSDAERAGNFSDLCPDPTGSTADCPIDPNSGNPYAGNQVPGFDPNAQILLGLIPHANSTFGGFPAYQATISAPQHWREELLRVDQVVNPKVHLMFRYIHDSWNEIVPDDNYVRMWWDNLGSAFPTQGTNFIGPGESMVGRMLIVPSSTLSIDGVMSFTTDHIYFVPQGYYQRPSSMTMTGLYANFGGRLPSISICCNNAYGGGFTQDLGYIPVGTDTYNSNPTYTYRLNFTKVIGNHNLQFGGYAVAAEKNELSAAELQGALSFSSGWANSTGNGFADMLLGYVNSFSQYSGTVKYYNRYKILAPYFQDDWRVTSRLTLNLGLRVSLFGTYREINKAAYNFEPQAYSAAIAPQIDTDGSITGIAGALVPGVGDPFDGQVQCGAPGVPAGCLKGHLFNPAPRFGFAWDPWGNGKTAIRGGYGIFFEHSNGNEANTEALEGSPPLIQNPSQNFIVGYTNIGAGGGPTLQFPISPTAIGTKAVWPYVQQWNLGIQHQLAAGTVLSVAYVGSKGTHLSLQNDMNQIHPLPANQNPFAAGQTLTSTCDAANATGTPFSAGDMVNGTAITAQAAINLNVACNLLPTNDPYRPYYGLSDITLLAFAANSNYNALQVSLRRNVGGLTLDVAYTYSHSLDNASDRYDAAFANAYNTRSQYASSTFDQRHLLSVAYVYRIPSPAKSGLVNGVLGGWQLSGITTVQTGTPFSIYNSTGGYGDNAGVGNGVFGAASYPDIIGNVHGGQAGQTVGGLPLYYDPNAFTTPTGLTFGNAGRDVLNQPSRWDFDAGLFKHIKVHESMAFEFRAEAFNLFNNVQWMGLDGTLGDSTFLQPTGAHRARTLQLGLKFLF